MWGRLVGASRGTLGAWCRAARTTPRRSLELARILRALVLTSGSESGFQDVMDIVDPRTVSRMFRRAGLPGTGSQRVPISAREFVDCQQLVRNPAALCALAALLDEMRFEGPEAGRRLKGCGNGALSW
jgi:hypothetical protein